MVAFDQTSRLLYVSIRQTFSVWFIPWYSAPVRLVTVLQLAQRTPFTPRDVKAKVTVKATNGGVADRHLQQKYYIASQEDLYQSTECIRFVAPGIGPFVWGLWQLCSTAICVLGSLVFYWVYIFLNHEAKAQL